MNRIVTISFKPEDAVDEERIRQHIANDCGINVNLLTGYSILKRSIDARSRIPKVLLNLQAFINEPVSFPVFEPHFSDVTNARHVIIAGAGPAGLFAALKLITLGIKPIILERGKDVRSRRRDVAILNREGTVNSESNYCFGEGGAGAYSDGKLYTRSTKRGNVENILHQLVHFGGEPSILYDAHPHIGTNKLPQIITAIRRQIIACGGEVLFEKKLTDIIVKENRITGVKTNDGTTIDCYSLILATGHSARDIFELLHKKNIAIESKPFALGVRIEHPQELIDKMQYHCAVRSSYLPPASYSLVSQQNGKGVFSFCMCPGGVIAPAATAIDEIVVNGWSPSRRNNFFANSGIVVSVDEQDFAKYNFKGNLAALKYQQMVEQTAYKYGGGKQVAPAQRLTDFVEGRFSASLPDCSYHPGINSVKMEDVLPKEVAKALKKGLADFGKKMKGYYTNEALLVATESRTSSPVRIPRDKKSLQHIQIGGLYPCGEGAGYAGGIVSAAIDGENCAEAAAGELKLNFK